MKRLILAICLLGAGLATLAMGGSSALAATLNVCNTGCPYSSIQQAINNASNGDTISIAPAPTPRA